MIEAARVGFPARLRDRRERGQEVWRWYARRYGTRSIDDAIMRDIATISTVLDEVDW